MNTRIKTLEIAASAAFIIGFFLVCGGGDLKTVLIGLPIFAFAAWGFNRIDKEKNQRKKKDEIQKRAL